MTTYRTGRHWGVTIVREAPQPTDGTIDLSRDQLVAVITNGDTALAERICALLNASDGALAQCAEETWSWEHFNHDQADGYWITCDLQGAHDEHKDENTGLTWCTQPES
uniref:hypothetical protein n=1 Tax=Paractinoplanes polyasparticus TaxID=2856853 RepID=UPI001C856660|nr:hypothetical protein [Actinoplanes polyasparticus]